MLYLARVHCISSSLVVGTLRTHLSGQFTRSSELCFCPLSRFGSDFWLPFSFVFSVSSFPTLIVLHLPKLSITLAFVSHVIQLNSSLVFD